MPYANNRGIKLFWEEYGSGPPVLLIMGLSFTHEMWFRVIPSLRQRYRTIAFDNRGVGRSGVPRGPYSIAKMAEDAKAVLDGAGVPAAHVIGASMGGMIAQELALRFPARVRSMVLACTTHGGLLSRWPAFMRPSRGIHPPRADRFERMYRFIPWLYGDSTPLERIEEDIEIRSDCRWCYQGFVSQLAGIMLWSSYRRLPRIRVPTLVVHGDRDCIVAPQNGRVVAARIPGAQFLLIPGAGHMLVTDQPELCQNAVLNFLREQEACDLLRSGQNKAVPVESDPSLRSGFGMSC
jgi:3-oxoadipate enol-lactonase